MATQMSSKRDDSPKGSSFTRLSSGDLLEEIVRPHEGVISRWVFADPEVFALEQERIFGRAWFFVGHESEIPNRGDVITRQCGLDPVLFLVATRTASYGFSSIRVVTAACVYAAPIATT